MSNDAEIKELHQVISAGEYWLRKHGMVSPLMHNNIVLNLRTKFSKIKQLEYFLPIDPNQRELKLVIYISLWTKIFSNVNKLIADVIATLEDYLSNYEITVEVKRFKGTITEGS